MTDKQKNYIRAKAIEQKNKERILEICPEMADRAGIYKFFRINEDGEKECYIGKAQKQGMLTRCAQHLAGYEQHIDLSLRKHGLYNKNNPRGWRVMPMSYCDYAPEMCDDLERESIGYAIVHGSKVLNVESGGTTGKTDITERKPARGYRDGVKQGERNVIKKIAHLFDKHLKAVTINPTPNKTQQKALDKFYEIIQGDNHNEES